MMLTDAVCRAIKKSKLTDSAWAVKWDIPIATLHDLKARGTANGRTLAKLQRAGVRIARPELIDSLDSAA